MHHYADQDVEQKGARRRGFRGMRSRSGQDSSRIGWRGDVFQRVPSSSSPVFGLRPLSQLLSIR